LLCLQLGRANRTKSSRCLRLQEDLILLLVLVLLCRLLLQFVFTLIRLLQLYLLMRHCGLLTLRPPLILNENLLEILLQLLTILLL
jgi:hypothetical protein